MDEKGAVAAGESGRIGLWEIASTFLGIGLASFSLAALGEAREWLTRRRKWLTDEEYLRGVALAQLLPGAPTVNLCSYLGYRLRGLPGAATATVFFLVPCFLSMFLLSYVYLHYGTVAVVSRLFRGLAALVVGLVFNTVVNLWQAGVKTRINWFLAVAGFVMAFWLKLGVIEILLFAGSAGLVLVFAAGRLPRLAAWAGLGPVVTPSVRGPGEELPAAGARAWFPGGRLVLQVVLAVVLVLGAQVLLLGRWPQLLPLGGSFLRIGAVVFGSGYAMLPFIQDTVVNHLGWLTDQQFAAALALSMITPGPVTIIGVFIGYKVAGLAGALTGMVDMYLPAWVMTIVAAGPYDRAGGAGVVKQVTGGIVATFIGTLWVVLIRLGAGTLVDGAAWALALAAVVAVRFGKVRTIPVVLAGAIVSMLLFR